LISSGWVVEEKEMEEGEIYSGDFGAATDALKAYGLPNGDGARWNYDSVEQSGGYKTSTGESMRVRANASPYVNIPLHANMLILGN
jgi:hypothetical protein